MSKGDEFKEKLSSFISSIKEKLPFGNKEDDDEYEEDGEGFDDDEKTAVVDVTNMMKKAKNPQPEELLEDDEEEDLLDELNDDEEIKDEDTNSEDAGEEEEAEDDEEAEDEDEDEEENEGFVDKLKAQWEDPEKKKQLIVRGVIGVLLVYLAFDMMTGEQEEKKEVPVKKVQAKRPRRKVRKKTPKVEKPAETPTPTQELAPEATKAPEIEPEATTALQMEAEPTVAPTIEPEATPEAKPQEIEKKEDIPPETPLQPISKGEDEGMNITSDDGQAEMTTGESDKMPVGESAKPAMPEKREEATLDLTSKISAPKSKDYISPPNYQRAGRGLVYNCVERHWACVDKFSYFQCRENQKWDTQNNKNLECVTKNVYATSEDCRIVQLHYINTNLPTDFCQTKEKPKKGEEESALEIGVE